VSKNTVEFKQFYISSDFNYISDNEFCHFQRDDVKDIVRLSEVLYIHIQYVT
jgi:hypothetical protein